MCNDDKIILYIYLNRKIVMLKHNMPTKDFILKRCDDRQLN